MGAIIRSLLVMLISATLLFSAVQANDLEGRIEAVNHEDRSLIVQGITFFTTASTDYDDGLRAFENLEVGMKVEIDFVYRDGKHYATEIERED